MARVALLEDDKLMAELLSRSLTVFDHDVHVFERAGRFTSIMRHETFDLLLLDWNLPDSTGLEVLRWCRDTIGASLPIIMVTGRDSEEDVIAALKSGADDYITKPVRPSIMAARVEAALRRTQPGSGSLATSPLPGVLVDAVAGTVTVDGHTAELSPKEFALAGLFLSNPNRPLSRAYLSERALGKNPDLSSRSLDVQVGKVKRKLNLTDSGRLRLISIYSFGYRLDVDPA